MRQDGTDNICKKLLTAFFQNLFLRNGYIYFRQFTAFQMNNYIVRSYRDVIVITKTATRITSKA